MRERIRQLLEEGWSRSRIARELEMDPTTVTRHARVLGFPDVAPRRSHFDWQAIQAYYDEGHTISECKDRFGFSLAAWDKAATRGDVVSRPRSDRQLSHATRDQVEDLLARGLSQGEVSRRLGLTKSTVAFHCRSLGRRADPRFARRYDWVSVQEAIDREGLSMTQCIRRFGFSRDTWADAVRRGAIIPRPASIPMDDLLVAGRVTSRSHLKQRLVTRPG